MSPRTTPIRINVKRDEKLEIQWQDGHACAYPIAYLRANCPCASCRNERLEPHRRQPPQQPNARPAGKISLNVLKGNFTRPLSIVSVERVGNYALRFDWSDDHTTGIYSFTYLREICPES